MPPSVVTSTSSIIIRITTVHPFATSWPSSPKGDARSVTGLAFCVIWHDKHSADWLTTFATPLSGCAGLLHGKACHTILRSLCSLTARLSPTHNILRVTAFLQNMFAGVTRVPLPPLCRGQNKTPRSLASSAQRIAKNKVPPPGERWWRQPPKGVHFLARQGGCMVSLRAKARLYSFPAPSVVP